MNLKKQKVVGHLSHSVVGKRQPELSTTSAKPTFVGTVPRSLPAAQHLLQSRHCGQPAAHCAQHARSGEDIQSFSPPPATAETEKQNETRSSPFSTENTEKASRAKKNGKKFEPLNEWL